MKLFITLFVVATAVAAPLDNGPVQLIVNGLPEGQPLEVADIVDIKLNQHNDGVVQTTNLLHPLTAAGIAEAAAEVAANSPEAPEAVALPAPAQPELIELVPEAIVLPAPALPEVVLPAPAEPEVVPEAVVLPAPALPEVAPEAVLLPAPAKPEVVPEATVPSPAAPEVVPETSAPEVVEPVVASGDIYNDGNVHVQLNVNSQETGYLSTLHGWFSLVINYFNGGVQTSQQIV